MSFTSSAVRAPLYLLILGTSWGLYFSLLKMAVNEDIPYLVIATLATTIACIGMLAISAVRRKFPIFTLRHFVFYCGCALLGYLVPMLAELFVIDNMPASVLALIASLSPVATLFVAWLMKTDYITSRRTTGVVIGALAVFFILFPDAYYSSGVAWQWLLIGVSVPLSYAVYHNYITRFWPPDSDSFQVACGETVFATVVLFVFSGFHWQGIELGEWNNGYIAVGVMGAIALVDIYIYFDLVRLRGPIYVSNANYFTVVSGVVWAMVFFAEQPSVWLWLSAGLLIVSLYMIGEQKTESLDSTIEKPDARLNVDN